MNIPNSNTTPVSGAPEIDKQERIGIKRVYSGAPEKTDPVRRYHDL